METRDSYVPSEFVTQKIETGRGVHVTSVPPKQLSYLFETILKLVLSTQSAAGSFVTSSNAPHVSSTNSSVSAAFLVVDTVDLMYQGTSCEAYTQRRLPLDGHFSRFRAQNLQADTYFLVHALHTPKSPSHNDLGLSPWDES